MSVIIHGLDMPDGCHHCRFSYLDKGETNDGEPCTVVMCSAMDQGTNGAEYDGNRPFWCPLVPLPEGHGRLIDADALEREISDAIYNYWNGGDNGFYLAEDALPEIRFAPTIVPAEGDVNDGA